MFPTVAAALSDTNSRLGTYIRTKSPEMTTPRYTQPASRAVFLMDSIASSCLRRERLPEFLRRAAGERDEQREEHFAHQPRRRRHRTLAFASAHHRRIVAMHIRDGARLPFHRREAAGMIRMAVRDDDVFEVGRFPADRFDRRDNLLFALRHAC